MLIKQLFFIFLLSTLFSQQSFALSCFQLGEFFRFPKKFSVYNISSPQKQEITITNFDTFKLMGFSSVERTGENEFSIDNKLLEERSSIIPAGKYYLWEVDGDCYLKQASDNEKKQLSYLVSIIDSGALSINFKGNTYLYIEEFDEEPSLQLIK